jgi:hypothetical protein
MIFIDITYLNENTTKRSSEATENSGIIKIRYSRRFKYQRERRYE